jgi:hypothetical protein
MSRKKKNTKRTTKEVNVRSKKEDTVRTKKKEDNMNIQTTTEETTQTETPAVDVPVTETPAVDAIVTETPAVDATVPPLGTILDLFHNPQQEGYATIGVNSHRETWALQSEGFRHLRERYYYALSGTMPSQKVIKEDIRALEGKARFEGAEMPVQLRIAEYEDRIYLDLANPAWEVVEITAAGWRIVDDPPVKFRRPSSMYALPHPLPGGTIEDLRSLVNIGSEDDWRLLVSFLVSTFRPRDPYPLLVLHGPQGAAKSTVTKLVRALIDPNQAPIRTLPRSERDLFISAQQGRLLAFDNLSALSDQMSDALCRLATGGGYGTRTLYTNADEAIFQATRAVILNGIEEVVTRGDLLDRSVLLHMPTLSSTQRREEAQVWREFENARPGILGALLDAVSGALRNLDTITLTERPRMADFARWSCAAAPALGWTEEQFLQAYTHNIQSASDLVLDASPLAQAVLKLVEHQQVWEGTATQLLSALTPWLEGMPAYQRPRSAQTLANTLHRLEPNLSKAGVQLTFHRKHGGNRDRLISINMPPTQASPAPQTAVPHEPCPIVTPLVENFLTTCAEPPTNDVPRPPGV